MVSLLPHSIEMKKVKMFSAQKLTSTTIKLTKMFMVLKKVMNLEKLPITQLMKLNIKFHLQKIILEMALKFVSQTKMTGMATLLNLKQ